MVPEVFDGATPAHEGGLSQSSEEFDGWFVLDIRRSAQRGARVDWADDCVVPLLEPNIVVQRWKRVSVSFARIWLMEEMRR